MALSLCVFPLAASANAVETTEPDALTDEQLDTVVAGEAEPPGVVLVTPGEGVDFLYVYFGSYPPPLVVVDDTVVNEPATNP